MMTKTADHHLIAEGWTPICPFQGDQRREGLISEADAPTVFEGDFEKKDDGSRVLKGLLQRANTRNANRRIYSHHLLERETKKLQNLIQENGGIFGELDHPDTVVISMKNACQRIDGLQMHPNGIVEGQITLLPTLPMGQFAIGCADALGGKVGESSRGGGTLYKRGDDIMVGEDYKMKTYDVVHDPSTHGARPEVVKETLIREFEEWVHARPATRRLGLSKLVDRYLGIG